MVKQAKKIDTEVDAQTTNDGWENLATGLGRLERDKRMSGTFAPTAPNAAWRQWENLYHGDDIAATIAELPSREMVREWISVHTDDSDSDETGPREAESSEERITAGKRMVQRLEELNAQQAVFESLVWSRVFGGSVILIGADDGGEMDQPLNEDKIRTIDSLTVLDRWDVRIVKYDSDIQSKNPFGGSNYNRPLTYAIQQNAIGPIVGNTPGIHYSRLIRFDGPLTSRRRIQENGGWNDSVYTRVEEILRDYGLAWGGLAHVLQDFAQGVYKIKHLAEMLASDSNTGENKVLARLKYLDLCRSVVRAIPVDADAEDFERKSTPLTSIPEAMDRFSLRLATAARMPVSLLLGQSPAGLQATGDSDIRFFYDSIKSAQQTMLRPRLEYLLRLIFKSADGPTKGREPENWSFTFNDLWQQTEEQKASVRKMQADTDAIYMQWEVVTPDEIAVSRFGGDKYSAETVLDTEKRAEEKSAEELYEPETMPPTIQAPGEPESETPEGFRGDAAARPSVDVQSVIFSRTHFDAAQAVKWAEDHGFKTDDIEEMPKSIRLRQRDAGEFAIETFRVVNFRGVQGVQSVIGRPA